MPTPSWPAELPQKLELGFSQRLRETRVRTPTDTGPGVLRVRSGLEAYDVAGEQHLTDAQVASLQTFYWTTLSRGSSRFTWLLPLDGRAAEFRFVEPPDLAGQAPRGTLVRYKLEAFV